MNKQYKKACLELFKILDGGFIDELQQSQSTTDEERLHGVLIKECQLNTETSE